MSSNRALSCEEFDDRAEDLALGLVDEPDRSELLAHVVECPACQSLLDGLGTVVDRLLLVAPQVEPPAGFENRALARLGATPVAPRQRFKVPLWAVASVALVVGVSGIALGRMIDGSPTRQSARRATIVTTTGTELGFVQLVADPTPHVLVTIPVPRAQPGVRNCELKLPNGTWIKVGSWKVSDIAHGTWAVGIENNLLGATAMRITTESGTTLATATFG